MIGRTLGHFEIVAFPIRIGSDSSFEMGSPEALFKVDVKTSTPRQYDTLDGKTFVVNRRVYALDSTPLTLALNAFSEGP